MDSIVNTERTPNADGDSTQDGGMTVVGTEAAVSFEKMKGNDSSFLPEEQSQLNDPKNPKNWSSRRKWAIIALVAFQGMLGPLTDSIYLPAILEVAQELDTTLTVINASISVYIFGMGFAALFWAPLSEIIGRRPVYIATAILYVVTSVICAISNSVAPFIVMRVLQSFAAGAALTVGAGTISDLFRMEERGTAVGIFFLGPLLGPVIGPIIGGYIAQYLGWHWIFWILTIIGGVILIFNIVLLSETLYSSNLPQPAVMAMASRGKFAAIFSKFPNPFKPLIMFRLPAVLLACFNLTFVFGWFYLLITVLPVAFAQVYGFSSGFIGLCYLANSVGNIIGAVGAGRVLDVLLARLTARNNGVSEPEMRIHVMWFGLVLIPTAYLIYGWTLENHDSVALPLFGFFLLGIGTMTYMTGTNSYLVDSYTEASASVSAANNFMMCIWAAITPLFANAWRNSMHDGWMDTIVAILTVLTAINIFALLRYGKYWRERFPA